MKNGYINADAAYLDFYLALIDADLYELTEIFELIKKRSSEHYTCFVLDPEDLDAQ